MTVTAGSSPLTVTASTAVGSGNTFVGTFSGSANASRVALNIKNTSSSGSFSSAIYMGDGGTNVWEVGNDPLANRINNFYVRSDSAANAVLIITPAGNATLTGTITATGGTFSGPVTVNGTTTVNASNLTLSSTSTYPTISASGSTSSGAFQIGDPYSSSARTNTWTAYSTNGNALCFDTNVQAGSSQFGYRVLTLLSKPSLGAPAGQVIAPEGFEGQYLVLDSTGGTSVPATSAGGSACGAIFYSTAIDSNRPVFYNGSTNTTLALTSDIPVMTETTVTGTISGPWSSGSAVACNLIFTIWSNSNIVTVTVPLSAGTVPSGGAITNVITWFNNGNGGLLPNNLQPGSTVGGNNQRFGNVIMQNNLVVSQGQFEVNGGVLGFSLWSGTPTANKSFGLMTCTFQYHL